MHRLPVTYPEPADAQRFMDHYTGSPVPLARRLPGLPACRWMLAGRCDTDALPGAGALTMVLPRVDGFIGQEAGLNPLCAWRSQHTGETL